MDAELKNLKIDRSRRSPEPSKWATRWIIGGRAAVPAAGRVQHVVVAAERGAGGGNPAGEIDQRRPVAPQGVVLNATGYIVAAHKIQVAAKVIGKVKWIGVDKGDRVRENDDHRAPGRRRVPGAVAAGQGAARDAAGAGSTRRCTGRVRRRSRRRMANLDSAKADLREREGDARPLAQPGGARTSRPSSRSTTRRRATIRRSTRSTRCRRRTSW